MTKKSQPQEYPFPSNQDAEESVIASIIIEPSWLDEIDLDPDDFFYDTCRLLYQACLNLRHRDEHIDEMSVAREVAPEVPAWEIPRMVSQVPTSLHCVYYAQQVKEYSQKRKLIEVGTRLVNLARDEKITPQQAIDDIKATLETVTFPSKSSRYVEFSSSRMSTSQPPTYLITVTSKNSKTTADIRFTSTELDNATAFKRKIRERLKINPILPKSFDALVHNLVRQAKERIAGEDVSQESVVRSLIREWFRTAIEAEHEEDLAQGYLDKEGAYWFKSTKMLKYLAERSRLKLTPASLWAIIEDVGRRSKVFRMGDDTVRLWGLNKSFFKAEQEEPVEGEQIPLGEEEEDLSWLEE